MDKKRLLELAGVPEQDQEHGNMDLFQDSLKIVFGLEPETIETIVALVRRSGSTMQIRDQQVRRRAGGRAVSLLKQAHDASRSEGDEQYDADLPEPNPEATDHIDADVDDTESFRNPDEEDPNRGNKR